LTFINDILERGEIEISPLAYMRGRTLNDAFIILDEAQNTTRSQMKMFLTRIGYNARAVVTGDITQIDLPRRHMSGLAEAADLLKSLERCDARDSDRSRRRSQSTGAADYPRV